MAPEVVKNEPYTGMLVSKLCIMSLVASLLLPTVPFHLFLLYFLCDAIMQLICYLILPKPCCVTEKVDVYSFAVVIWTVARNKPPFRGYDRAKHRTRGI